MEAALTLSRCGVCAVKTNCGGRSYTIPLVSIWGKRFKLALYLLVSVTLNLSIGLAVARPYAVDDQLRLEALNRAFFSPDGEHIILEYSGRWDRLSDPGLVGGPYDRLGASKLLYSNVRKPKDLRPLFEAPEGAGYWVDGFSPDSKRLAISWFKSRVQKAGVYDLETREIVEFAFTPYLSLSQTHPVWISNNELVYATTTGEAVSAQYFDRLAAANRLNAMWDRSWKGAEPAVSVLISGGAASDMPQSRGGSLIRVDARTGEVSIISTGIFTNLTLSPNRRFLAALRMGGTIQARQGKPDPAFLDRRSARLEIFDLHNGNARIAECSARSAAAGTLQWALDSTSLLMFSRRENERWESGKFVVFDTVVRKVTEINHAGLDLVSEKERRFVHRPEAAAWIDGRLAVFARRKGEGLSLPYFSAPVDAPRARADWFLVDRDDQVINLTESFKVVSSKLVGRSADAIFVLADGDVWRLVANQAPRRLTENAGHPLELVTIRMGWNSRADTSTFAPERQSYPHAALRESNGSGALILLDLESGKSVRVQSPAIGAAVMAISDRGQSALYYSESIGGSNIEFVVGDRPALKLKAINTHLAEIEPARRRSIVYSVDGDQLKGCALFPPKWVPGRRYPTVVDLYPSSSMDCSVPNRLIMHSELIASWGYIYFKPETPRRLIRTSDGPVHGITKVVLAAIDQLVEEGLTDPHRIGLYGESQGGFVAPWVLTQTNRFAVAVAVNGGSDHASLYGEAPLTVATLPDDWLSVGGFSVGPTVRYEEADSDFYLGGTPWEIPNAYVRSSAYFQSGKITSPLMLVHSDMDFFPMAQYEMLFTSLYRQGKRAQLVRYWGEGHSLLSPANLRDRWRRTRDWYRQFLGDSEWIEATISERSRRKE